MEIADATRLPRIAGRAHCNLGDAKAIFFGDIQAARDHFLQAETLFNKIGDKNFQLYAIYNVLSMSLELGELAFVEKTLAEYEEKVQTWPHISDGQKGFFRWRQAELQIHQGLWREALQEMRTVQKEFKQLGDPQNLYWTCTWIAQEILQLKCLDEPIDLSEADTALDTAIGIGDRFGNRLGWRVHPRCLLSILNAHQGRDQDARTLYADAEEMAGTDPTFLDQIWLKYAEAELAVAEKRWEDALAAYAFAAGLLVQKKYRTWWAFLLMQWAETHISHGKPMDIKQARGLLNEAQSAYEDMDSPYFAGKAKQRLEELAET